MLSLPYLGLHFYPLFTSLLFLFTFTLTYLLAASSGHTEWDWPYISDTAVSPPESCIFSQLINLGALGIAITVYIRYKQVHEFYISHQINHRSCRLNQLALWIGWAGALGISIIANFQETAVIPIHYAGAVLAFGVGSVYLWTQVYSSYVLCTLTIGTGTKYFRVVLASVSSVGFVLCLVTEKMALERFHGDDHTKWRPDDGGWGLHVISTVSEWIVSMAFNLFMLSFMCEFRQVTLDSPKIVLRITRPEMLYHPNDSDEFQRSYADAVSATDYLTPVIR